MKRPIPLTLLLGGLAPWATAAAQDNKKPNIVVWGDDIGWFDPSCHAMDKIMAGSPKN